MLEIFNGIPETPMYIVTSATIIICSLLIWWISGHIFMFFITGLALSLLGWFSDVLPFQHPPIPILPMLYFIFGWGYALLSNRKVTSSITNDDMNA